MNFYNEDIDYNEIAPGMKRKVLANGGNLMTVKYHTNKGVKVPTHSHIHEQIGYIISGLYKGIIDEKESVLKSGDSYYVKPNQKHGLICLEDGVFLDIFTPQREDFK